MNTKKSLWEQLPDGMPKAVREEFARNDAADERHRLMKQSVLGFWTDYLITGRKEFKFKNGKETIPVVVSNDGIVYFAIRSKRECENGYLLFCIWLGDFRPYRHSNLKFLKCLARLCRAKKLKPFKKLEVGGLNEVENYLKALSEMKMTMSF